MVPPTYIHVPPMITLASHGMALFCRLPLVMQSLSASGCLVHCARDVGEHVDIAGLMRCVMMMMMMMDNRWIINGPRDGWMDGWMEWVDGSIDGWVGGREVSE